MQMRIRPNIPQRAISCLSVLALAGAAYAELPEGMTPDKAWLALKVDECTGDAAMAVSCLELAGFLISTPGNSLTWQRDETNQLTVDLGEEAGVDWPAVIEFSGLACKLDDKRGCEPLMTLLTGEEKQGITKPELLQLITRACHDEVWYACGVVGLAHGGGAIVPQNRERAFDYLSMGCNHDEPSSCYYTGLFYDYGHAGLDAASAKTRAMPFFQKSCDLEFSLGCTGAGKLLQAGVGVEPDPEAAMAYLTKGCELGDPEGCDLASGAK